MSAVPAVTLLIRPTIGIAISLSAAVRAFVGNANAIAFVKPLGTASTNRAAASIKGHEFRGRRSRALHELFGNGSQQFRDVVASVASLGSCLAGQIMADGAQFKTIEHSRNSTYEP